MALLRDEVLAAGPAYRDHLPTQNPEAPNNRVSSARGRPTPASHLLRFLAPNHYTILKGRRRIWGHDLSMAGLRLAKGDYLILITDHDPDTSLLRAKVNRPTRPV